MLIGAGQQPKIDVLVLWSGATCCGRSPFTAQSTCFYRVNIWGEGGDYDHLQVRSLKLFADVFSMECVMTCSVLWKMVYMTRAGLLPSPLFAKPYPLATIRIWEGINRPLSLPSLLTQGAYRGLFVCVCIKLGSCRSPVPCRGRHTATAGFSMLLENKENHTAHALRDPLSDLFV
jgi:hypothetical protein